MVRSGLGFRILPSYLLIFSVDGSCKRIGPRNLWRITVPDSYILKRLINDPRFVARGLAGAHKCLVRQNIVICLFLVKNWTTVLDYGRSMRLE